MGEPHGMHLRQHIAAKWTLWQAIFRAGMPGVFALAWLGLPALVPEGAAAPMPAWALRLATVLQSALLLALAAWGGARLAPRVGLQAPVAAALVAGQPLWPAARPLLLPGLAGGGAGAVLLAGAAQWAPEAILRTLPELPLLVRVLYGGVTEEILLRWGVMSALAWAGWRVLQRGRGALHAGTAWLAIALSALLFAAGHLPAAHVLFGGLTASVVAYVVAGNAAFGLLAGWLYWRRGLEAAVLAHMLAHVFAHGAAALAA
jgi:membrane protease YdiL (CAAX protease family)